MLQLTTQQNKKLKIIFACILKVRVIVLKSTQKSSFKYQFLLVWFSMEK